MRMIPQVAYGQIVGWLLIVTCLIGSIAYAGLVEDDSYVYFLDAGGSFWKVDVKTNQVVAKGKLETIEELKKIIPTDVRDGVLVNGLHYDPNLHRLYLVAQKNRKLAEGGKLYFQILILELPSFRLVTTFPQEPFDFIPNFLVTPDGEKLLVSYSSARDDASKQHAFILETYSARDFKLLETKRREVTEEELGNKTTVQYIEAAKGAYFSGNARFSTDGVTIYDGEYQIVGDQVIKQTQQPLPIEIEKFLKVHPTQPGGPRFLLERLGSNTPKMLLMETEFQERSAGPRREDKYRVEHATGRFGLYDPLVSSNLREFHLKELEGDDPKIIGSTPDGRVMYFAKGRKEVYAVNLKDLRAVQLDVVGLYAHSTWCVFADR